MNRKRLVFGAAGIALVAVGYTARALASGIPSTGALTYAGVLESASGPVTGTHTIQVTLYDAATGGNNLCQSSSTAVQVTNGHFSALLPDNCATAIGANQNTWVDVVVDSSDTGRTKIGAVPYAVEANHAVTANSAATLVDRVTTNVHGLDFDWTNGLHFYVDSQNTAVGWGSGILSITTNCTMYGTTGVNCACPSGQVAVTGGGWCGNGSGNVVESAHALASGGQRDMTTWRFSCSGGAPGNAYALCALAN